MTHAARLSFIVLLAALPNAIFAQAGLPIAKPESLGMSSKRLDRIHAFIQDYIDTNQIAGAVTLVARKGKVVHFESQGWRYKEENQPMEKDALFSLASMTKPIVSSALMMLWEDGKFMLDDPISKGLPSYAKKDVLNPLTGVRCSSGSAGGDRPKTLLEAIERAAPTPLAFQPGERWQYGTYYNSPKEKVNHRIS